MRTLVIDTATSTCSVALFDDQKYVAGHYAVIGRGHAEKLVPFIAALPNKGRADRIFVNIGPGSFTGIRVGVAAAKALAFAWGVPCSGYGCLDLVAAMVGKHEAVDVVMAGGHGEYFFQSFDAVGASLDSAVSLRPEVACARSMAQNVGGDAANAFVALRGFGRANEFYPDARKWHLIADKPPLPATPLYGRAPDAALPKVQDA
jgi:tRNA threonylcarbamoyladenosine biosynthesis protein TsaB